MSDLYEEITPLDSEDSEAPDTGTGELIKPDTPEPEMLQSKSENIFASLLFMRSSFLMPKDTSSTEGTTSTSKVVLKNRNIYSERLLLYLIKHAQKYIYGINWKTDNPEELRLQIGEEGKAKIWIPVDELVENGKRPNYVHIKKAVQDIFKGYMENEELIRDRFGRPVKDKNGKEMYRYSLHHFFADANINSVPGMIDVELTPRTWQCLLDFSKGFRKFDYQFAKKLKHTTSVNIFQLISNQNKPQTYTIEQLRKQWGLTDKYPSTSDFLKKTVQLAKEELDESSPWTFDFKVNLDNEKDSVKGRKKIKSVTFFPIYRCEKDTNSGDAKMVEPRRMLGKPLMDLLLKDIGFERSQITNNLPLLVEAMKWFDLFDFVEALKPDALRANSPRAYVIGSIQKRLAKDYNIVITKEGILKYANSTDAISKIDRERRRKKKLSGLNDTGREDTLEPSGSKVKPIELHIPAEPVAEPELFAPESIEKKHTHTIQPKIAMDIISKIELPVNPLNDQDMPELDFGEE